MNGLVSVILPVYNVEKYIREALDSVTQQTYENLEIILVDDGTPDSSGDICDEYADRDRRIKVIHKENGGVSSARNAGIEAASGDWIYFMDPDDWIELDTIETAVGMAAETGCDMCMFDFEVVYKDRSVYRKSFKGEGTVFRDLSDGNVFLAYACAMGAAWRYVTRAENVKRLRFDENFSMREDELFTWELYGKISSFCYLSGTLYHYRCVSSSAVNSIDPLLHNLNDRKIYNRELEIVNSEGYPQNAADAVHSKYISGFYPVVMDIFSRRNPLAEKLQAYKSYISGREFSEAVTSFSDIYLSNAIKLLLRKRKAPHWLAVYIYVMAKNMQLNIGQVKKF